MVRVRVLFGTVAVFIWILALKTIEKLQFLLGLRLFVLDAESLVSEVERKYGRKISVAQNQTWLSGLRHVVSRTNDECTDSHLVGRWMRKVFLTDTLLRPLLQTEAAVTRNPDILNIPVSKPIFITGTGRNGSTLLQGLLAHYPSVRYLTIPDCVDPAPLDESREFDQLWRQERDQSWADFVSVCESAMFNLRLYSHPLSHSTPEECILVISRYLFWMPLTSFNSPYEGVSWAVSQPEFTHQAYEMFKWNLQLVLYYNKEVGGVDTSDSRYVLKCPLHTPFHSVIREVFPDAMIIRLHRDPVEVASSHSSMLIGVHKGYPTKNDSDLTQIGQTSLNWVKQCCNQMQNEKRDGGMIDIQYVDLIANPVEVCLKIAKTVGLNHTSEVEQKLITHLKMNPQHKHGVHVYKPIDFGLNPTQIRKDLHEYCEMFGV